METHGYKGKLLKVDLTNRTIEIEPLNWDWARRYMGGAGLASRYLYDEISPSTSPTDPENPVIFMTGPVCGTRFITSGRHHLVSLSPLTGIFGESDVGGAWGEELKKAGFDGIILKGKASKPVYLGIEDGRASLSPAEKIWELDPYEVEQVFKEEWGPKARIACIGTGAIKGALIAGVMHDGADARAAGRCGIGSVMAEKRIKAVVVKGTGRPAVADEPGLRELVKRHSPIVAGRLKDMRKYGTARMVQAAEHIGSSPLQNWKYPFRWEDGAARLSGPAFYEKGIMVKAYFCRGCVIGCGNTVHVKEGPYRTVEGGGPEYETLNMLGGNCLVDDLEAVCLANELCYRYGIDTIETGALLAFAMEAYEAGIITDADTGGVPLKFGDPDAMLEGVRMIGESRNIGSVLNKGFRHAVSQIDDKAKEFAIHVKGLAIPAHDPRAYNGLACSYATSNRGAHHTSGQTHLYEHRLEVPELNHRPMGRFVVEGKGALAALTQNIMNVLDSVKSCKFAQDGGWTIGPVTQGFCCVTGRRDSIEDMLLHGERAFNLKRVINVERGISRKDDVLPKRMLTLEKNAVGYTANLPPLDRMLDEYYETRGWSKDGIPLKETLERLEIPSRV
ncbi:MAG: aldehyde ferredoxin oxidoreductase family protein [Deltaproteobacteria bacterium]|nr:aldehyde ferredoxin oxidoreductase family protein [Deltaproteobacteria bacterium]